MSNMATYGYGVLIKRSTARISRRSYDGRILACSSYRTAVLAALVADILMLKKFLSLPQAAVLAKLTSSPIIF